MKKTYKLIAKIVAFSALFVFGACIDLEEDTSGILSVENISSESDVMTALAPVYRSMQEIYFLSHRLRCATYGGDDITTWWGGNKHPFRVFDQFDFGSGENSDHDWLHTPWNQFWQTIYRANSVLDKLETSTADPELVAVAQGEARFMRAMAYFFLVRTWGNMPNIVNGMVPTGEEQRATVLENYQLIEEDLLFAEANLPGPGVNVVGRASSAAASTMLADLYLTWAGWPVKDESKYTLAAQKAKKVIDLGYFTLLPFDELWKQENQNSLESIFAIQFSEAEDARNQQPQNFSFHEAGGWSDAYPERQFFYDFPEGLRKDITFRTEIPQRTGSGGQVVELGFSKPWQESQRNHPMYYKFDMAERLDLGNKLFSFRAAELYRYAEVLLIYAEAQAHLGETAASIEALNMVKRRALGLPFDQPDPSVDVTTATPAEIVQEKAWELAAENKRWFDMIRTEIVEEVAAHRDPTEEVALVRQPTKANYIAPIPSEAISTSKLVQNPEGFKIK